tara:strand:- start:445 stop:687 length:243 start_codon:yes stop_codon:yes gene_type:complete
MFVEVHITVEVCEPTLVKLETTASKVSTASGHLTDKDMTIESICKCVSKVRLSVECSALAEPLRRRGKNKGKQALLVVLC